MNVGVAAGASTNATRSSNGSAVGATLVVARFCAPCPPTGRPQGSALPHPARSLFTMPRPLCIGGSEPEDGKAYFHGGCGKKNFVRPISAPTQALEPPTPAKAP